MYTHRLSVPGSLVAVALAMFAPPQESRAQHTIGQRLRCWPHQRIDAPVGARLPAGWEAALRQAGAGLAGMPPVQLAGQADAARQFKGALEDLRWREGRQTSFRPRASPRQRVAAATAPRVLLPGPRP